MQFIRFGYLGKRFSGANSGPTSPWILSTTYWNDNGRWFDTEYWLDGLVPTALYYGIDIFTYNGGLITYE